MYWELVLTAWECIIQKRTRSLLTVLGIVIGIAAVIILLAIGKGADFETRKQIQSLGSNLIYIMPGAATISAVSSGEGSKATLTLEDAEAIADICPAVLEAVPVYTAGLQVQHGRQNTATRITATTPPYSDVRNTHAQSGRFISQAECDTCQRVCVLGDTVAKDLFADSNPLDQSILIRGQLFRVVGVMEHKGYSGFADNDDMVYVPLSTGFVTLFGINPSTGRAVKNILVMPKDADEVSRAQFQIMNVLRLRHKIVQPAPDDFSVRTQSDLLDMVQSVNKVFTSLLAATAAISLLVGGIGIMNIMLVSVSEKTREIGIRKAVGAKFRDIMLQFMTESILLSSAGGLLGIACGVIGANLITLIVKWATIVTLSSVLTSFLVATMIGLFFGIYPAKRASQLDPIVALRAD